MGHKACIFILYKKKTKKVIIMNITIKLDLNIFFILNRMITSLPLNQDILVKHLSIALLDSACVWFY